jgi:hypothetical protein
MLSGRYPDARYASFNVYTGDGTSFTAKGVSSVMTDYRIAPDAGSVNPWQKRARPGGRFTVTLRPGASPEQVNTLPLAPEGTASGRLGYVVYRVYLPAGGPFSKASLTEVAFEQGSSSVTLPPCRQSGGVPVASPSTSAGAQSPAATGRAPARLRCFRPTFHPLFPNADSAYLAALVVPPAGGRN